LGERLAEAGIDFEELVIYRSQDVSQVGREIYDKMTAGEIEWTTVTSSAIGSSLVNLFGVTLEHTKIATISPTTTAALQRLGIAVAAEAKRYDLQGIVQAIEAEILKQ
jgi:uroporphyrinogen-III synthase